jgi:hypothetical protein
MTDARRGKFVFWTILGAFAVGLVSVGIWSWTIVGNVRATAAQTDARLRELAWAVLAYADGSDGFPTSEAELRAFVGNPPVLPEALVHKPLAVDGRTYPMTRAEAGAPAQPAPLDEVLASIEVEWPIVRDVQPILRPRGLPTLQGTGSSVGDWLYAMAERLRAP